MNINTVKCYACSCLFPHTSSNIAQAAWGAIETYLQLYANMHKANAKNSEASSAGKVELTAEEKKKQKQKQRKVSSSIPDGKLHAVIPACIRVHCAQADECQLEFDSA